MKIKLGVLLAAVLFFGMPHVSLASVKAYTHTNAALEFAVQVDTSWKVAKDKTASLFVYPKTGTPKMVLGVVRADGGSIGKADRVYLTKGWKAYVEQHQKDYQSIVGSGSKLTYSDTKYFMVNGYHAASMTMKLTIGSLSQTAYVYLVSRDPHAIYEFSASGSKDLLPKVEAIVKSIRIDAVTTNIFTDRTDGYSLRYPAWWLDVKQSDVGSDVTKFHHYMDFTEWSHAGVIENAVYDVQVKRIDTSADWTAGQRSALKQGWNQFMSAFLKVYDHKDKYLGFNDKYIFDGEFKSVSRTAPVQYGLHGYTASIFFETKQATAPGIFQPVGTPLRRVVIVVTKNMKDVYMIVGTYTGKTKTVSLPSPFNYDFRALAQSFRIL